MLYRDDLAFIHDASFGGIARSAAPVLLEALERAGLEGGLVIDLGCGSGLFAEPLAAAGYDVLGVDVSPAMLRLARSRVPEARFRRGSLHHAELPPAVAVAGIGECFSYFTEQPTSERGLARLMRRIHRALRPGGVLLFDMAAPGKLSVDFQWDTFKAADWAIVVKAEEDRDRSILTRRITSFRNVGSRYRRSEEVHRQKLFEKKVVIRILREVGFRTRALAGYGELPFPRGLVGYLGSKTSSGC